MVEYGAMLRLRLLRLRSAQAAQARRAYSTLHFYGGIERGDTDVNLSRLEKIAEALEIDLADLFDSRDKKIFNFGGTQSNHDCQNNYNNLSPEQMQLKYEFEKQQLTIDNLQKEVAYLKEIVELMKKGKTE